MVSETVFFCYKGAGYCDHGLDLGLLHDAANPNTNCAMADPKLSEMAPKRSRPTAVPLSGFDAMSADSSATLASILVSAPHA